MWRGVTGCRWQTGNGPRGGRPGPGGRGGCNSWFAQAEVNGAQIDPNALEAEAVAAEQAGVELAVGRERVHQALEEGAVQGAHGAAYVVHQGLGELLQRLHLDCLGCRANRLYGGG